MKYNDEHHEEGITGETSLGAESTEIIEYLIKTRLKRRTRGALIRNSFVRSIDGQVLPPLSKFSSTRGGAEVALKLEIALLWLSAAKPYDTDLEASDWARMLDLPDPGHKGAARVRRALITLENNTFIKKEHVPKQRANRIILLKENGSGDLYTPPKANRKSDQYFAVPNSLWEKGHIQKMSASALTMLLIMLEEQRRKENGKQWWTQREFQKRFHISKDTRAKGTKELEKRGLLVTRFEYLRTQDANPLAPRKTRKVYRIGEKL